MNPPPAPRRHLSAPRQLLLGAGAMLVTMLALLLQPPPKLPEVPAHRATART